MNARLLTTLVLIAASTACGDVTTLTGPDAVAAAEQYQASAEEGELNIGGTPSNADRSTPLIFVDGKRAGESDASVLSDITPADIERIEVVKGCRARELWGEDARNGVIHIYTKSFEGDTRRYWPEGSEARAEACRAELQQRRSGGR